VALLILKLVFSFRGGLIEDLEILLYGMPEEFFDMFSGEAVSNISHFEELIKELTLQIEKFEIIQ